VAIRIAKPKRTAFYINSCLKNANFEARAPCNSERFFSDKDQVRHRPGNSKNLKISAPKEKEQGNAWVASYSGVHPEAQRRFASFTVVNGKLIANFYYEALDMSEEEFDESRNRILGGVRVSE
jgi:hypothetical protein